MDFTKEIDPILLYKFLKIKKLISNRGLHKIKSLINLAVSTKDSTSIYCYIPEIFHINSKKSNLVYLKHYKNLFAKSKDNFF